MPVYEFECRDCMTAYNKEIDKLVKNYLNQGKID